MTTNIATARDVTTALSSIGFRPSIETIQTVSRYCREPFLNHLSKCIAGQDNDGSSKKIIISLLHCLSSDTLNRFKKINPDVTENQIVSVALKAPTKLLSAIEAASNPEHERHTDAKFFLTSVFPLSESAPIRRPQDATNTREKKFLSCHVYGSGYALCFNASEWDGKPGVMVDAAISTGSKSYDWKNAIHVWLDTNEVGAVLAVFRRWRKGIEFAAHGSQNDKAFSIEFQGQHFFAKVTAKKAENHPARAVKIMPTDATAVSILFLTQLAESYPAIPLNELLATVCATHQINDV